MAADAGCAPSDGQVLAGRYRLDTPLTEESTCQPRLWRGTDQVLNRPVAVKVHASGSPGADELLSAAVATGRVAHPHVASVYDAARVGSCTYVVSEWVEGRTLPRLLADGPLEPSQAAGLIRQAAEAVAALHAQGLVHGDLRPQNVLVTADGEVKLTAVHAPESTEPSADVAALGALLYAALTDRWPDSGPQRPPELAPAPRENGQPCTPRQVRAGVPGSLSALTMRALSPTDAGPSAATLALELTRHAHDDATGPLPVVEAYIPEQGGTPLWRRVVIPVVVLVLICTAGFVLGIRLGAIPQGLQGYPSFASGDEKQQSPGPLQTLGVVSGTLLDPSPLSDHTEQSGLEKAYDGKTSTAWQSDVYTTAHYGNLKKGMGISFDLGASSGVTSVTVLMRDAGATVELLNGDHDGTGPEDFTAVKTVTGAGKQITFTPPDGTTARYWAIWITKLPPVDGGYQAQVAEVRFATD